METVHVYALGATYAMGFFKSYNKTFVEMQR